MTFDPDQAFDEHRSLLFTIAYELTSSAADAEDVVQETYLRWREVDHGAVHHPRAYLAQTAARLALNSLRSAARRREDYVGPWLPEPILTTPDVADDIVLTDSVSTAMLVVLDTLGPDERAVFVLHEVFGFSHPEIAVAIGKSAPAVRQIAHRARRHVHARRPDPLTRGTSSDELRTVVLQRFAIAATSGDIQQLMDVLAPEVVLLTDGGGRRSAALRPIFGARKAAGFIVGIHTNKISGELRIEPVLVNGEHGAAVYIDDVLDVVVTLTVIDGSVSGIFMQRNPDKLTRLEKPVALAR